MIERSLEKGESEREGKEKGGRGEFGSKWSKKAKLRDKRTGKVNRVNVVVFERVSRRGVSRRTARLVAGFALLDDDDVRSNKEIGGAGQVKEVAKFLQVGLQGR